jgi:hypothetical protein
VLSVDVVDEILSLKECGIWAESTRLRQHWLGSVGPLAHLDVRASAAPLPVVLVAPERVVQSVEGVVARVVSVVA